MNKDQEEIKLLKFIIKAQNKIILCYRMGDNAIPEWVWSALEKGRAFYNVTTTADIK